MYSVTDVKPPKRVSEGPPHQILFRFYCRHMLRTVEVLYTLL